MEITDLPIPGLKLLTPRVFPDKRGYFLETYNYEKLAMLGFKENFVQDNLSFSLKNALRGLHFQYPAWQGKLVSVVSGLIFDVAVDIRRDSPTFGKWHGVELDSNTHKQFYIPPGFAHGFYILSGEAHVIYKCTAPYRKEDEHTIIWNDPEIGIEWSAKHPILSLKDATGKRLKDLVF
jgi:dTDP-4-dehydrorhamnose 3,5-epimerase